MLGTREITFSKHWNKNSVVPSLSPSWRSTVSCYWSARSWWRLLCQRPCGSVCCRWCRSTRPFSPPETWFDQINNNQLKGTTCKHVSRHRTESYSLGKKMGDSKLWQGLPGLYEAHLCLNQAHLCHILMGFQDTGRNLWTITHIIL